MNEEILTDTLLRQYLLGKVNDEERERIEKLFLTDSQARDRVLAAEQDLIEDYLEDSLTTEDQEIFVSLYARTPEQQRNLRINKTIKDWAVTESQTTPNGASIWSRFLETIRLRPAFVVPIAVAILVAIVVAYVWLNRRMEYWAIEKEVAQLNTPASLSQTPSDMVTLQLAPVTLRSGAAQNEVPKRADTQSVEFQLLGIHKGEYPTYQAVIRRVGDNKLIATADVEAEGSNPIRVRLPAHLLTKGSYRIEVIGIAADGSSSPIQEYTFVVDN